MNQSGFHGLSSGFFERCSNDGSPNKQTITFHAILLVLLLLADVLNFSNYGMSIIIDFFILNPENKSLFEANPSKRSCSLRIKSPHPGDSK